MTSSSVSGRDLRAHLDVDPGGCCLPGLDMPDQVPHGLAELIPCAAVDFCVMVPHNREVHADQALYLQLCPTPILVHDGEARVSTRRSRGHTQRRVRQYQKLRCGGTCHEKIRVAVEASVACTRPAAARVASDTPPR